MLDLEKKREKDTDTEIEAKPHSVYSYKAKVPGLLRILFALILFYAELALIIYLSVKISALGFGILAFPQVGGLLFAVYLWQRHGTNSYNVFWIILVLFFPLFGLLLYFFWGRKRRFRRQHKRFQKSMDRIKVYRKDAKKALKTIPPDQLSCGAKIQLNYLAEKGFALYTDTELTYFPSGESQFERMFQDMEKAENYIFLEYFILSDGYILDETVKLLIDKAKKGLDIRLLYDDFGTVARVDSLYMDALRKHGIKIINFNPVLRYTSGFYKNYRNHRKVCLIDGEVAWMGGTNLADEYANIYTRFGYWKDTAIRLQGNACHNILSDFMVLWEHDHRYPFDEDYSRFLPALPRQAGENGIVVPYWDGPFGDDKPAVSIFTSMFSTATDKIYIMTPYFILEDDMINLLCQAAKSGVDVRLITPGIPDKPQVFVVTRSNYGKLLKAGCRVFEYTPGFIHAKTILVDDDRLVLGSINLDFRSLYLNFENAVYICNAPVIKDIERDILETLEDCEEITLEKWKKRPLKDKLKEPFYKTFSPLI